jgi:hypothetical protein
MGRTTASMWLLGRRLRTVGYATSLFGYRVRRTDLDEIARRFADHVHATLDRETATTYAIVGHSLGNLVARLASPLLLTPPNQPPVIARWLRDNPLFRLATRDAGSKLADASYVAELPVPVVPSLIIAGTRGLQLPWLPFEGPNDAIVQVEETRLEGVPTVQVPGIHTFLMNRNDVFAVISEFLAGNAPTMDNAHRPFW